MGFMFWDVLWLFYHYSFIQFVCGFWTADVVVWVAGVLLKVHRVKFGFLWQPVQITRTCSCCVSNWSCALATWPNGYGHMASTWESGVRSPLGPSALCHFLEHENVLVKRGGQMWGWHLQLIMRPGDLAEGLGPRGYHPGVWGSKPTWAICAVPLSGAWEPACEKRGTDVRKAALLLHLQFVHVPWRLDRRVRRPWLLPRSLRFEAHPNPLHLATFTFVLKPRKQK